MATPAFTLLPVGPTSGGKVWPFNNISTSPQQVVAANPPRATITFVNPGTVTIYVAQTVDAQGNALVPSLSALGGCFPVGAGLSLQLSGEVQMAWQALAASGTTNPLTVMESRT
jgi:hypothetical protein